MLRTFKDTTERHVHAEQLWVRGSMLIVRHRVRPLTAEEVAEVNMATIRESMNHRRWPKEIIQRFLEKC